MSGRAQKDARNLGTRREPLPLTDRHPAGGSPALTLNTEPLMSVVITSYTLDRWTELECALDSLRSQTYRNLEIIVVTEGPRELRDRVRSYADNHLMENLTVVVNDGLPGLSPARNLGIRHARGEIIGFIDDDATAGSDWAARIVGTFARNEQAIGLTGPAYPRWQDESCQWLPEEFYWIISCTAGAWSGPNEFREVRNALGVNMAFRREAFSVQSFSEKFVGGNQGHSDGAKGGLLGEDTEFCLKLRHETKRPIYYCPDVSVEHHVGASRLTAPFIWRRCFWEGYTKATLGHLLHEEYGGGGELASESRLLRRILFHLLPRIALLSLRNPRLAWQKFGLTVTVLGNVALGFAAARIPFFGRRIASRYS